MRNGVPQASGSSNAADVVATSNGFTTVDAVLDAAKTRFQSAVDWGERYDLSCSEGGSRCGVHQHLSRGELTGRYDSRIAHRGSATRQRCDSLDKRREDRAQQQYREAKSKLEAVLSASDESRVPSVVEAKQLHAKLEEALASEPIAGRGRRNRVLRPRRRPARQSSKVIANDPAGRSINELQTLTEDLGGAQRHLRWTIKAHYSTHEYRGVRIVERCNWALPDRPKGVAPR